MRSASQDWGNHHETSNDIETETGGGPGTMEAARKYDPQGGDSEE
jgi:hypothetical protein